MIVPAILPSSRRYLEEKLALIEGIPSVTRVQIDTVDGKYISPPSWPYTAPSELTDMVERGEMLPYLDHVVYEIDLMAFDLEQALSQWVALGATRMTLHVKSNSGFPELLSRIHQSYAAKGIVFGIAIDIETPLGSLETNFMPGITYVQFMGIDHIGLQGQSFDSRVLDLVRAFHMQRPEVTLQIDGGISLAHAKECVAAGATDLVVGSALMESSDLLATMEALKEQIEI